VIVRQPLLEIENLSVRFRRRRSFVQALDGVSFTVGRGETVGLVGESGSGKSTVGGAVLGLTPVEHGSVRFDGTDITNLPFKKRRSFYRHIQVVFQDPYSSLNPSRTVGSTLAEPLESYGIGDRSAIRAAVQDMLEQVHLPADAAKRYPRQFSGGQRQRIAIARALMLSPQLIVFDEPTSALDLSVQAQILNLLQELQRQRDLSYLFISHDLDVVRHLCDRVVVLYQGRVMETGTTDEVAERPAHPYTEALHAAIPLPNPRLQRGRERDSRETAVHGGSSSRQRCLFSERCEHVVERCWSERPVLRESDHGLVACHRYPEWRAENLAHGNGAALPVKALELSLNRRPR
jgi:oligopeptide/dipeptide ABC transporter ATP-binding protein